MKCDQCDREEMMDFSGAYVTQFFCPECKSWWNFDGITRVVHKGEKVEWIRGRKQRQRRAKWRGLRRK